MTSPRLTICCMAGERWCGAAGYQGGHKRVENLGLAVEWRMAMRPRSRRKLEPGSLEYLAEKLKASVRAKSLPRPRSGVEHPFLKVKRVFSYGKVRYRGLAKNTHRLALLLGLGNLMTAERQLAG